MATEKQVNFIYACSQGDVKKAKKLLNSGININAQGKDGKTALIWACRNNQIQIVKLLLQNDAIINIQDKTGVFALAEASWYGYVDIVKLLVKNGAKLYLKNEDGKTALDYAKENLLEKTNNNWLTYKQSFYDRMNKTIGILEEATFDKKISLVDMEQTFSI